jgi:hypothetical protein
VTGIAIYQILFCGTGRKVLAWFAILGQQCHTPEKGLLAHASDGESLNHRTWPAANSNQKKQMTAKTTPNPLRISYFNVYS